MSKQTTPPAAPQAAQPQAPAQAAPPVNPQPPAAPPQVPPQAGAGEPPASPAAPVAAAPEPSILPAEGGADPDNGQPKPGQPDARPEGVPETPDGYELALPEGLVDVPELTQAIRQFAHDKNLSQEDFKRLTDTYASYVNSRIQQMAEAERQGVAQLKEEWGADFKANVAAAQKATGALTLEVPGLKEFLVETGLHSNPMMLRMMAAIGQFVGEAGFVAGGVASREMERTKTGQPKLTYQSPKT